jgi:flagellar biosynthesis/type III secretory pathway protein FliH
MNTIGKVPATTQDVEAAIEKAVDTLALMINEGFKATASKEDMTAVKEEMKAMENRLTTRLDRIEHLLLAKQEQRLNELGTRMKNLEDALAV